MFCLIALDAALQIVDGRGVGAGPAVEGLAAGSQEQQHRHPHIGDQYVDGHELTKERGVDAEDFFHRCLVGAAADPGSGHRGHAAPSVAGDSFGVDESHQPEGDHGTQHHAEGSNQKHDDRLGAEPHDRLEIDGDAQQDQGARQQVVAGHRVQARGMAIDDAGRVQQCRYEVAQQDGRHHAIELLPESVGPGRGPEHQAQDHRQHAEHDRIVAEQGGRCFRIFDRHQPFSSGPAVAPSLAGFGRVCGESRWPSRESACFWRCTCSCIKPGAGGRGPMLQHGQIMRRDWIAALVFFQAAKTRG